MKQYLYIALICSAIAIYAATFIGCASHQVIVDTCETRAVSTTMKFKIHDIPHRLAVGKDHVAVQVLKDDEWKFLARKDTKYFQPSPVEYMSLQRYLKYLIVRYNTLEKLGENNGL